MAWIEAITSALPPFISRALSTLLITLLTVMLAWGIRPAIKYLLDRVVPRWSGWGATLVQLLVVSVGAALIDVTAGRETLLMVLALALAFCAGLLTNGPASLGDFLATRRIHARSLYRVGDRVTIGNRIHGIVTEISRTATKLDHHDGAKVTVRNGFVVRHPIVVHAGALHAAQDATQRTLPDGLPVQAIMKSADSSGTTSDQTNSQLAHGTEPVTTDVQLAAPTAPLPPALSKRIHSPVAAPLSKRQALGRRTVHDLR